MALEKRVARKNKEIQKLLKKNKELKQLPDPVGDDFIAKLKESGWTFVENKSNKSLAERLQDKWFDKNILIGDGSGQLVRPDVSYAQKFNGQFDPSLDTYLMNALDKETVLLNALEKDTAHQAAKRKQKLIIKQHRERNQRILEGILNIRPKGR